MIDNLLIIINLYISSEGNSKVRKEMAVWLFQLPVKQFLTQKDEGIVHGAWYCINKI